MPAGHSPAQHQTPPGCLSLCLLESLPQQLPQKLLQSLQQHKAGYLCLPWSLYQQQLLWKVSQSLALRPGYLVEEDGKVYAVKRPYSVLITERKICNALFGNIIACTSRDEPC